MEEQSVNREAQQAALFRVQRRVVFMRGEAETHLLKAAAEGGDAEALRLAGQVEQALRALEERVHAVLWEEEDGHG